MTQNTEPLIISSPRGQGPAGHGQLGRAAPWIVVALLLAGGGGWWWWKSHPSEAPGGAASAASAASGGAPGGGRRFGNAGGVQPVSVQAVRRQDIRISVSAIGTISAANTAVVRAQVSGVLQRIDFKEGQQVRAGQLLAQIDPRAFQATLSQTEGVLARDKAQLDAARVDLARYRDLLAKDAIPRQQLDTQTALVAQLEGTVKADQGTVDNARLQLAYTRVTAPIAGRVGLKQADLGNVVQPGDANGIVSITQTRPVAMVFAVPATHVPLIAARLRGNDALAVEAWDRAGRTRLAAGRVASIDNAIDATTDSIKVKALFPNADDALYPNQSVSVTLQLDTLGDTLAVPQAAVLRGAQGFYVYVVNADMSVSTRVVKPGPVDAGWMAVEGALQADEKVVIDGTDRLREGARVEVIAADPRQRQGAAPVPGGGRRGARGAASGASAGGFRNAGSAADAGSAGRAARGASSAAEGPSADRRPDRAADVGGRGGERRPDRPAGPGASAAEGERPRWMDRLTPEQAAKVQAMSPDERRAWFRAQREARDAAPAR
jgi:multidrug efflux system membrane fusion protein